MTQNCYQKLFNTTHDVDRCLHLNQQDHPPPPRAEEAILEPIYGIVPPPVVPTPNRPGRSANQLEFIQRVVMQAVWKHQHAWPFHQPVDAKTSCFPQRVA